MQQSEYEFSLLGADVSGFGGKKKKKKKKKKSSALPPSVPKSA